MVAQWQAIIFWALLPQVHAQEYSPYSIASPENTGPSLQADGNAHQVGRHVPEAESPLLTKDSQQGKITHKTMQTPNDHEENVGAPDELQQEAPSNPFASEPTRGFSQGDVNSGGEVHLKQQVGGWAHHSEAPAEPSKGFSRGAVNNGNEEPVDTSTKQQVGGWAQHSRTLAEPSKGFSQGAVNNANEEPVDTSTKQQIGGWAQHSRTLTEPSKGFSQGAANGGNEDRVDTSTNQQVGGWAQHSRTLAKPSNDFSQGAAKGGNEERVDTRTKQQAGGWAQHSKTSSETSNGFSQGAPSGGNEAHVDTSTKQQGGGWAQHSQSSSEPFKGFSQGAANGGNEGRIDTSAKQEVGGWAPHSQASMQKVSTQVTVQHPRPQMANARPAHWRERWRQRYEENHPMQEQAQNQQQTQQAQQTRPTGGFGDWQRRALQSLVRSESKPSANVGPFADGRMYAQSLLQIGQVAGPEALEDESLAATSVQHDDGMAAFEPRGMEALESGAANIAALQDALERGDTDQIQALNMLRRDSAENFLAVAEGNLRSARSDPTKTLMRSARSIQAESVFASPHDEAPSTNIASLLTGERGDSLNGRDDSNFDLRTRSDRHNVAGRDGNAEASGSISLDSLKQRLQKIKHAKTYKHKKEADDASEDSTDESSARDHREQAQSDSWWNKKETWWKKRLAEVQQEDDVESDRQSHAQ